MAEIIIIAAVSENGVIGHKDRVPWNLKTDLEFFKATTRGFPCIMGRKTWESLPLRPLPDRKNIVITRQETYQVAGATVVSDFDAALREADDASKVFICGGAEVYASALQVAHKILLTQVHLQTEGDTFFPKIDPNQWKVKSVEQRSECSFVCYEIAVHRGTK